MVSEKETHGPASGTGRSVGRSWPSTLWDLIREGRDGSVDDRHAALERLFRQYYTPVLRFFEKILRVRSADLEDLTQEFFTRFVEKEFLKNVAHETSFRNFLKVACRRHFIDWLRSRRPAAARIPLHVAEELAAAPERMDEMIDAEVQSWMVEEALARARRKLLGEGKELQLKVFEAGVGLSGPPAGYKEIAARFGIGVYDVGNHISAGRLLVKKCLMAVAAERSDDPSEELESLGLQRFLT